MSLLLCLYLQTSTGLFQHIYEIQQNKPNFLTIRYTNLSQYFHTCNTTIELSPQWIWKIWNQWESMCLHVSFHAPLPWHITHQGKSNCVDRLLVSIIIVLCCPSYTDHTRCHNSCSQFDEAVEELVHPTLPPFQSPLPLQPLLVPQQLKLPVISLSHLAWITCQKDFSGAWGKCTGLHPEGEIWKTQGLFQDQTMLWLCWSMHMYGAPKCTILNK